MRTLICPKWRNWRKKSLAWPWLVMAGLLGLGTGEVWSQSSWTLRTSAAEDGLNAVVFDGTRFVAVGEAGALTSSTDGELWSAPPYGTITGSMRGLIYTGTQYVACGQSDSLFGTILTSADGSVWKSASVLSSSGAIITSVATNGVGVFVACGSSGRLYRTKNTLAWPSYSSLPGSPLLQTVTYGGGWFVTVGELGTVARSRDGLTWTVMPTGTTQFLAGITYGNGRWVAVGSEGTILTSLDLTTWTPRPGVTGKYLFSANYEAGQYVVTGGDGTILTSPDGLAWTLRPTTLTTERIAAVVEGNDQVVAVGELSFETAHAAVLTAAAERPPGFRWSAAVVQALEAQGSVSLTLQRVGSTSGTAEVEYSLLQGTATFGVDLPDTGGIVTFADGESSRVVTLPLTIDEDFEGEENFLVELRTLTPGWAALRPATAVVLIRDAQDSDADNLPDAWERKHFPDLSQQAEGDPDGDGNTNLVEYTDSTVPTDGSSALYFLNLVSTGNGSLSTTPPLAPKFARDIVVTVQAIPADGWELLRWTGAGEGTELTRTVLMTGDLSLEAAFGLSLGGALEAQAHSWTTSGTGQPWFGQQSFSHDEVDAAQSGFTPPNSRSTLSTKVIGPATISFWWSASCRANSDALRFAIDGEEQASRSGAAEWEEYSFDLAEGEHTLSWTYSRGPLGPIGFDAGWVDSVAIGVSGYTAWLPSYFTTAELADVRISGPSADPDGDGVPNLAEFAFGTLPRSGNGADPALPRVDLVTTASGKQRALTFKRPNARVGLVAYQAQWSSDLKAWNAFGSEQVLTSEGGIDVVRVLDPMPPAIAPRRLYRVKLIDLKP